MARVTPAEVRGILDLYEGDAMTPAVDDATLQVFIDDAAMELDERHANAATVEYSEDRLTRLERYLAAHFTLFVRERQTKEERVVSGSAEVQRDYSGTFGEGLSATSPGQTVLELDYAGVLDDTAEDRFDSKIVTRHYRTRVASPGRNDGVEGAEEPEPR